MNHPINLNVERMVDMDDREVYNVSDCYVKGKLSRFAVDPADQSALHQRELPKEERELSLRETADVFDEVKQHLHDVLYDPLILPRHHHALVQMQRSVESQLEEHGDAGNWKRAAQGFLDLVKDEVARAEVMLDLQSELSARKHLQRLLDAIQAHRDADEDSVELADDQLYLAADEVSASLDRLVGGGTLSHA